MLWTNHLLTQLHSISRLEPTILRAVGFSELCESCLAMTVAGMAPSRRSLLLLLLHSSSEESFLSFAQTKVQIVEGTKDYLRAKNGGKKIFFIPPEEFDFSPEFFIPRHGLEWIMARSSSRKNRPKSLGRWSYVSFLGWKFELYACSSVGCARALWIIGYEEICDLLFYYVWYLNLLHFDCIVLRVHRGKNQAT